MMGTDMETQRIWKTDGGEKVPSCHKAMKGNSDHMLDAISDNALLWLISTAADPPLSFGSTTPAKLLSRSRKIQAFLNQAQSVLWQLRPKQLTLS